MNNKSIESIPPLLTLKEASEFLGCHPNTLRKWDKEKLLTAVRLGSRGDRRYKKEDIIKFVGKAGYVTSQKEASKVSEVRRKYFDEYASLLVKWGNLNSNSVFVDVPCGTGEMTKTLADNGFGKKFYLMDINPEMVESAKRNVKKNGTFILSDAVEIKAKIKEKVDAIFCLNGFHIYIEDKEKFLKGCFNVLKPGGTLIFDVSTKGIGDAHSQAFLEAESKEMQRLAQKAGVVTKFPSWPDENDISKYRLMAIKSGLIVDETISVDKWVPVEDLKKSTLKIPGRLRPWLPGISDVKRISMYTQAHDFARNEVNIKTIKHNRVFFVAKKPTK